MKLEFMNLESRRLVLTNFYQEDTVDVFEFCSKPDVTKYLSWNPHESISESEQFVMNSIRENEESVTSKLWAIRLKDNNRVIGVVRAFDCSQTNKRIEISYILNPSYQGNGYIGEALNVLLDYLKYTGIQRVQAKCTDDNHASEKVLLKLGMNYEGALSNYWIFKGVSKNAKSFSLTL